MKKILIFAIFTLCTLQVFSQERSVSGTVTDASDGTPLPGVNVIIKGSTTGVSADFDGNYTIKVPNNNVSLEFSYIGYESQIVVVGAKSEINIMMNSSSTELSEVVVTAFGI